MNLTWPDVTHPRIQRRTVALALLLIVSLGLLVRADSLAVWLAEPERYFFAEQQRPLLLGVDGYYYLDIAAALRDGDYQPFDPRRQVPQGYTRSATPPLLSVLTAGLAAVTGVSLEWIAIVLPPLLGIALAIPVWLLARALAQQLRLPWGIGAGRAGSGEMLALTSVGFALLSPFLVSRSGIGWYETDPLNVFFATLAAFLALACGEAATQRRALGWLGLWALNLLVFLWWWDQTPVPVLALAGLPVLVALVQVIRRWPQAWRPFAAALAGLALVLVLWKGTAVLDAGLYLRQVAGLYDYIGSQETAVFRPAGAAVSEQSAVSAARLMRETAGGWLPFALALTGLLVLGLGVRQRVLYLVALLLVTLLSFSGARFMIFAAPLFGLGMGMLAWVLWNLPGPRRWRVAGVSLVMLAVAVLALLRAADYNDLVPRREPALFDAMLALRERTPADAVFWASWGHGHPLVHYTQRGTLGDGIYHPAELQYALNVPLAMTDQRQAANWMAFVAAHGVAGLRQANERFGADAEDWAAGMARLQALLGLGVVGAADTQDDETLAWLFPGAVRPLYLLLNELSLSEGWYLLGRWDFATRSSPKGFYLPLQQLRFGAQGQVRGVSPAGPVALDLRQGQIQIGRHRSGLEQATLLEKTQLQQVRYREETGVAVHLIPRAGLGVFASSNLSDSLLNRLFFEFEADRAFFTPVLVRLPSYSVWQVQGERF